MIDKEYKRNTKKNKMKERKKYPYRSRVVTTGKKGKDLNTS